MRVVFFAPAILFSYVSAFTPCSSFSSSPGCGCVSSASSACLSSPSCPRLSAPPAVACGCSGPPSCSAVKSDATAMYGEAPDESNPLKSAGLSFVSASSKSLGMLFYNIGGMDHKEIQALLLQAGTHLVAAGEAWTTDWDTVRESMDAASGAFYDISDVFGSANIDESMPLGMLFEKIGRELEDISSISGCCAVGPPCSSPNLLAVEEHLTEVGKILKKNSVASTDEHMMCTLFKEVAELFGEMAGRYVDNEGQNSEVSV